MALTVKQEAFAQHYAAHRKPADAYRHAYDVGPDTTDATVSRRASELLSDGQITARISEIIGTATASAPVTMTVAEAFARWVMMATADRNELIGLKVGACRHCWGVDHGFHWKEHEYLKAMEDWEKAGQVGDMPDVGGGFGYRKTREPNEDCPACEGEGIERIVARDTSKLSPAGKAIYGGVKQTRNGIELIIADQGKALENASRILGAFKDNVRIDGTISGMATLVDMSGKDPAEAARLYLEMVQACAVK